MYTIYIKVWNSDSNDYERQEEHFYSLDNVKRYGVSLLACHDVNGYSIVHDETGEIVEEHN